MPEPSLSFKRKFGIGFVEWPSELVVLFLMSSKSLKYLPFKVSLSSGSEKSHWGLDPMNRRDIPTQLFV
jgi:hypothetical protein